ncbi:HEAT repeat domain-containing protein [Saccharibacillus alkalitolerans]|uniref:HEAT repeat domain-containing protein n=1 Tax=Saccharibacillus alkalitolerans TaxID=2705290 RepID=A0ABX0F8Y9_9BACL|nr:hypothetical protein [Saccharibacillus alkalitolerans]NGZ76434.1 hypothetical protein [Saccharibacillus alkalitolerans]
MSTTLLQELQGELRRLYIAGSDLAAEDFRLKKLEPKLAQLGERAPVFKRMAEDVAALTGPSEPEARAAKLQDVSLLLNSVLSTQGRTAAEGVTEEKPESAGLAELTASHSYRQLAEVQNALSTSGGGRYEIVTSAYQQGLFRDLRLFPFAVKALNDSYSELADYAVRYILPSYGRAIVPYLLEGLNMQGGREEERRLEVVRRLGVDPDDKRSLERLVAAAEEGADKVRAAAIACLGSHPDFEERLLEWSLDKKKSVREGALAALAVRDSSAARDRLYEAFTGKDAVPAAEAIGAAPSADMIARLVPLYEERLRREHAGEDDRKSKDKLWKELEPFTIAFRHAKHPELERLFLDMAASEQDYPSLGRLDFSEHLRVMNQAAGYLEDADTDEALAVLQALEERDPLYLQFAFHATKRLRPASELYDRYAGTGRGRLREAVSKKAQQIQKKLIETLREEVYAYEGYVRKRLPRERVEAEWDRRWLGWLIDRNELELVAAMAVPGEPKLLPYLEQQIERSSNNYYADYIFTALDQGGFDEDTKYELLMRWMERKDWKKTYSVYRDESELLLRIPDRLAGSAADRLEPLAKEARTEYVKETMQEIVHSLRRRAESAN